MVSLFAGPCQPRALQANSTRRTSGQCKRDGRRLASVESVVQLLARPRGASPAGAAV